MQPDTRRSKVCLDRQTNWYAIHSSFEINKYAERLVGCEGKAWAANAIFCRDKSLLRADFLIDTSSSPSDKTCAYDGVYFKCPPHESVTD
jgi:hypothetical protein